MWLASEIMIHELVSYRAFWDWMQKALTPHARINPSRCLSVNASFFVAVYTQMEILGARSRARKRTRVEMNRRAKVKIKASKRMTKMTLKAMVMIKKKVKIKVCTSLSQKSQCLCSAAVWWMVNGEVKWCNNGVLYLPVVWSGLLCSVFRTCSDAEQSLFTVAMARWCQLEPPRMRCVHTHTHMCTTVIWQLKL